VPVEKLSFLLYVFVPDREPDLLTDSHVKLDIVVHTQEPLSTRHHKIAFEYDEDTMSLVVDPTLSTLDISISKTPIPLLGTHQFFNMNATRSRTTHIETTTTGLRLRSLNRTPVTICTADTIGTIRSQRLF
jgi:hypothetical protein